MEIRKYDVDHLSSFTDEWNLHNGCSEWWYCTGFLETEDKKKFSYQFTLINTFIAEGMTVKVLMLALTDLQTGEHHYSQTPAMSGEGIILEQNKLSFHNKALVDVVQNGMHIKLNHKAFSLDLELENGKGAFWHCDNGKLYMGTVDEKETTYYYSYTNMPTKGTLSLIQEDGAVKTCKVTGKTWFDKQGGTYETKRESHWEWFSLRFFDNEEVMLFTFPVTDYIDGTYITSGRKSSRLNNYTVTRRKIIEVDGMKWSSSWDVYLPGIKEEHYTITPYFEGNINFTYFEELCSIKNKAGEEVGMCFVELLPLVLNETGVKNDNLTQVVEY